MMKEREYLLNSGEGSKEYCSCGNLLKDEYNFSLENYDDLSDYFSFKVVKILTCPACESLTVLLYTAGEQCSDHTETQDAISLRWIGLTYKKRILYSPKESFHHAVPHAISEVTNQAKSVLYVSSRASFILCRAVLEEICNDFDIPTEKLRDNGKTYFVNLKDRLSQLSNQENFSEDLQSVIEGIRELGNEGAHSDHLGFSNRTTTYDAERLLRLVEYAIEKLYIDKYRQREAIDILNQLKDIKKI
jgi:Domain of unknown function (DUF4145)